MYNGDKSGNIFSTAAAVRQNNLSFVVLNRERQQNNLVGTRHGRTDTADNICCLFETMGTERSEAEGVPFLPYCAAFRLDASVVLFIPHFGRAHQGQSAIMGKQLGRNGGRRNMNANDLAFLGWCARTMSDTVDFRGRCVLYY